VDTRQVNFCPSLYAIHPTSWKGCSRKSMYENLYNFGPMRCAPARSVATYEPLVHSWRSLARLVVPSLGSWLPSSASRPS
jgi:hypothetical protein